MTSEGSDAYYRNLFEHLGMAVIATDADFNIRVWNAAAARVFGAGSTSMKGTPIISIVPQDRRRAAERMLKRAVREGETIQFEFHHRDTQGVQRELAGTIAPVCLLSGERAGASICVRDITRHVALQSELSETRKMASLGEMAGSIAHHFNNILGGAVTSLDFARSSDDPAIQTRVLDQMGDAIQRAVTLVNGMLAFAEGDRRAEDQSDFTETVAALADEIERETAESGIVFRLTMPELPVIPVAGVQVATVFRNIVRNAIEAMPDGGKLDIDVSNDGTSLIILFEDTGCGLDEATKSRIFEPFWTTKGTMAAGAVAATGLGLAIAHGLVHMMDGTITVTSEVGKGSCFRVTLPLPKRFRQRETARGRFD
jgi:PAS domain S-box-containing protein